MYDSVRATILIGATCALSAEHAAQNLDYGGFYVQSCYNLTMHGPATLTYATAALGFTQACSIKLNQQLLL